mgnify:FL=1
MNGFSIAIRGNKENVQELNKWPKYLFIRFQTLPLRLLKMNSSNKGHEVY